MRFMVLMIPGDHKKMEAGAMPDEKLAHAMMAYNEELSKAGVLLALDGLHPTSKGARIRFEAADFGPEIASKEAALLDEIGKRL